MEILKSPDAERSFMPTETHVAIKRSLELSTKLDPRYVNVAASD